MDKSLIRNLLIEFVIFFQFWISFILNLIELCKLFGWCLGSSDRRNYLPQLAKWCFRIRHKIWKNPWKLNQTIWKLVADTPLVKTESMVRLFFCCCPTKSEIEIFFYLRISTSGFLTWIFLRKIFACIP